MKKVFIIISCSKSEHGICMSATAVCETLEDAIAYCKFHEQASKDRNEECIYQYKEVFMYDTPTINIFRLYTKGSK